jgi:hypothetical protein
MKDDYKQGDRVKLLPNSSLSGLGTIRGVATNGAATIGRSWIVELDVRYGRALPFSHVVLFSNMLEPVTMNVDSTGDTAVERDTNRQFDAWADDIDDCKKRSAVHDLSVLAYRMAMVIQHFQQRSKV